MLSLAETKIPPKRLLLYLLIACWLPLGATIYFYLHSSAQLQLKQERLWHAHTQLLNAAARQQNNLEIYQRYRNSAPHYIDHYLETQTFLAGEIAQLQALLVQETLLEPEPLETRLRFLTGKGNQLEFRETGVESNARCREIQETLQHPVEVDGRDLEKIFALIEGVALLPPEETPKGRPQMILTEFRIDRKCLKQQQEVYVLDLKLLKREFL
jgi:hypothetical protein